MIPILLAGHGRAGTSAFMQMLATDPAIGFERIFPYERRELSYFARLDLITRRASQPEFNQDNLIDFNCSLAGPMPWKPEAEDSLSILEAYWPKYFEDKYSPARFYSEKSPPWLAALVRRSFPCFTVYMLRDPRDLFLSAAAFTARNAGYGFGKTPEGSEIDWARNLCFLFVSYFENYWSDRQRADSILVRYEDYVESPERFVELVNSRCGTQVRLPDTEIPGNHATSLTRAVSVYRYRREPLSPAVSAYLNEHLAGEMKALGYDQGLTSGLQFCFREGMAAIKHSLDGNLNLCEDHSEVTIHGGDFWTILPLTNIRAGSVTEAWLSIQSEIGEYCSVYWRRADESFSEERSLHVPFHPGAHWQVMRFILHRHPLWRGTVQELRLDIFNGRGTVAGSGRIRWFRLMR